MSLRDHFVQMARNNAWSNLRLYHACRQLSAAELSAPRTSFFPSILLTLQHIWNVDEYYVDGLERGGRGMAIWAEEQKHGEIGALWAAQDGVDRRLLKLCERSTDDDWASNVSLERSTGPEVDVAGDIVAHLFVHQIHHRGQVHAMLAGTKVKPPQLDEWFMHNDRKVSSAELEEALAFTSAAEVLAGS